MANNHGFFDAASSNLSQTINLIEASAGTGKTYTIAMLVLRFVVEYSLPIEEILLVTFTKAATEELADRIRQRLVDARDFFTGSTSQPDPVLKQWSSSIKDKDFALLQIKRALRDIDQSPLFTIHGFCQRMLQEQALETSQLFDVELKPDIESVYQTVAKDFWRKRIYTLPPRQCGLVLDQYDTPGEIYQSIKPYVNQYYKIEPKTGSLTEAAEQFEESFTAISKWWSRQSTRLCTSLEECVDQGKMKKEFASSYPQWKQSLDTYFSGKSDVLPEGINWLQQSMLLQMVNGSKVRGAKKTALVDELKLPDQEICALLNSITYFQLSLRRQFTLYLVSETEKMLNKANVISYDDLIIRLHRAVTDTGVDTKNSIQQRFKAVLIDEFQDTDSLQWQIFSSIFGGGKHFFYLIGDPKQAIYRFRGADINSYFIARESAGNRLTLKKNYRSHPGLVHEINRLFLSRNQPFVFKKSILGFEAVDPAMTSKNAFLERGGSPIGNMVYCQLNRSVEKKQETWTSAKAATQMKEFIAAEVIELLDSGVSICSEDTSQQLKPSDIAILVRNNKHAEEYQRQLKYHGVPAVILSKQSIYLTNECLELYSLLRALAYPGDSQKLKQAMTISWLGLRGPELYAIWNDDTLLSDFHYRFQKYSDTWLHNGVLIMMKHFLEEEKVFQTLGLKDDAERRIANIHHLLELIQQAESDNAYGPLQMLQWLQKNMERKTAEDELRLESDDIAVKIITMHGAKGLEFPVVFCPYLWYRHNRLAGEQNRIFCYDSDGPVLDLGSERFEERRKRAMLEDMAEELRLLYVAITRAKLRCYVLWCDIKGRKPGPTDSFESGLGYLLFPDGRVDFDEQKNILQRAGERQNVDYILIDGEKEAHSYVDSSRYSNDELHAKKIQRATLFTDWRMTSYSALVSGVEHVAHTTISAENKSEDSQSLAFATLPSGANFGNAVHDILESLSFQDLAIPTKQRETLQQTLNRYSIALDIDLFEDLLVTLVTTSLSRYAQGCTKNFSLAMLDEDKCLKEMAFYYYLDKSDSSQINSILSAEKTFFPLNAKTIQGYLTGFVDLIFEYENRFYIADYKTNNLGDSPHDYGPEKLTEAMASHNYGLQFWLYSLVLHKHLKNLLPKYTYQQNFGGVFYFFVRGMDEQGNGIYFQKPELKRLESLARCFGDRQC